MKKRVETKLDGVFSVGDSLVVYRTLGAAKRAARYWRSDDGTYIWFRGFGSGFRIAAAVLNSGKFKDCNKQALRERYGV